MNNNMLQVSELSCIRGDRRLFTKLSFELQEGQVLYLRGRNGSGKTTLQRSISGLFHPDAGEILWKGERISELAETYFQDVLYIGHAPGIKLDLTAVENLRFQCRLKALSVTEEHIWDALQKLGLAGFEDLPARVLSAGQKRRIALARLFVDHSITRRAGRGAYAGEPITMITAMQNIVHRDLMLAMRRKTEVLTTLFFFIIVISLFPLGIGSEKQMLVKIAPGVVWVAALLASMLALERLFASDYDDGTLEQMLMMPQSISVLVLGKVFAHWLLTGLPLVLIAPLVGLQYQLPDEAVLSMMLSLLVGTPVLSLIGAIGAALTLGVRGGGILLSLLILPLYIPLLIYGSGAIEASMLAGTSDEPYLMIMAAFAIIAIIFAPWATGAALKIAVE